MEWLKFKDYEELAAGVAARIADVIRARPDAWVCIASGHTPVGVFKILAKQINAGTLDVSKTVFVSLDEWIGVDPLDPGSCIAMLRHDFFDHVALRPDQILTFNTQAADLQKECDRVNHLIAQHGGLDAMLVGIGTNGHIGMNEPGTSFKTYAHISQLAEETITTGQKYFTRPTQLSKGITLGLRHFAESKLPIVMANGPKKKAIIDQVMTTPPTETIPATIVHQVQRAIVATDLN